MRLIVYTLIFFNILTFALGLMERGTDSDGAVRLSGQALDLVQAPAVNSWQTPTAPELPSASFPADNELNSARDRDISEAVDHLLIAQGQVPAAYTPERTVTQLHYKLADYCLYVGPFEGGDVESVVRNLSLNGILADIERVEVAKEVVETRSFWQVIISTTVPDHIITLIRSSDLVDLVSDLQVIKSKTDFDDMVTLSAGLFSQKSNAEELKRELQRISINSIIDHVDRPVEGSERVVTVDKSYLRLNRNNTSAFEQAVDRELFIRLFDVDDGDSENYVRVFRSDKCSFDA